MRFGTKRLTHWCVCQVQFAASAKELIGPRGRRENQQTFSVNPRLGELHHLIHVVGYELTSYELLSVSIQWCIMTVDI